MIDRRSLLLGSLLAGAVGTLAACSGPAPTQPQALTIGLTYIPNVQFSAFYLGVDKGIFADHGVQVKLRHHGEQEDIFGAVLRGDEDIVFASADEAMVASANGNRLQTFATSYQRYPLSVLGLDGTISLPPNQLEFLEGKRLGIPGHFGSSYYAALCAIHSAGLTEKDVTLVDIGYTALSALETQQVDLIVGFANNELVQLVGRGKTPLAIPVTSPSKPELIGPSLIVRPDTVPTDVLRSVAKAMAAAEQAVIDDPEAALEATAKQVPALSETAQRESAERVLKATTQMWLRDGKVDVSVDEAAFGRMGEFLTTAGVIKQAPEAPFVSL